MSDGKSGKGSEDMKKLNTIISEICAKVYM